MIPEISELLSLLTLVRKGGFAEAARELGVTQPSVTGRIAKLEQALGLPLVRRRPGSNILTPEAESLLPFIEEIEKDFSGVMSRISYWSRACGKEVSILIDNSRASRRISALAAAALPTENLENWQPAAPDADWTGRLEKFECDIVIGGTFLDTVASPSLVSSVLFRQPGITVAWNPALYPFDENSFNFREAVSSSLIMPPSSGSFGFREFITSWSERTYRKRLTYVLEASSERSAADLCQQGVGVLLMPGDAESRLDLRSRGLGVARCFTTVLPDSYVFGIHYRKHEKSPQVLATIERILELSLGINGTSGAS